MDQLVSLSYVIHGPLRGIGYQSALWSGALRLDQLVSFLYGIQGRFRVRGYQCKDANHPLVRGVKNGPASLPLICDPGAIKGSGYQSALSSGVFRLDQLASSYVIQRRFRVTNAKGAVRLFFRGVKIGPASLNLICDSGAIDGERLPMRWAQTTLWSGALRLD